MSGLQAQNALRIVRGRAYTVGMSHGSTASNLPKLTAVWLAAVLLALASAAAGADEPKTAKPKASSFAPHHAKSHVHGAPVSKPILHKRKKNKHPAPGASPQPIK